MRTDLTPYRSFGGGSQNQSDYLVGTPYKSFLNNIGERAHSILIQASPPKTSGSPKTPSLMPRSLQKAFKKDSPGVIVNEMKLKHLKFVEALEPVIWGNKEEEWFYTNKRLIFATRNAETA
jgi:hypothetical protein